MVKKKWIILAIVTLAFFMTPLDTSITNVAMPSIAETYNIGFSLVALVPLFYLLSMSAFMIPFGKLADIYGRKYFFIAGLIIFTIASFLSGIAGTITQLIAYRFLQGFGASLIGATSAAIVTESFPKEQRGMALGINLTAVYIALTTGPFLGGLIVQAINWRYIFFINIPIGIITAIAALIYIKDIKEVEEVTRFNWKAAAALIIFIISLVTVTNPLTTGYKHIIITLGLLSFVTFLMTEIKSRYPIIGLKRLIHNRMFIAANITALLSYIGLFAISFMMAFYLIDVRELTPLYTGLMLSIMPIFMAILSPLCGHLSDRFGSKTLASSGMAIITIGLIMLGFLKLETSLIYIGLSMAVTGIGMGLFSSPNTSAVMGSVEKQHLGLAGSVLGTTRFVGQALSITLMTVIVSRIASKDLMDALVIGAKETIMAAKGEFITASHYTFFIFAGIIFIGIFTSLARKKR